MILLHGYPQTSHMWRHQLPVLGERFKVYAPDTRGYGGTDKPRVRLDRSILARDVLDFMDALGIEHRVEKWVEPHSAPRTRNQQANAWRVSPDPTLDSGSGWD